MPLSSGGGSERGATFYRMLIREKVMIRGTSRNVNKTQNKDSINPIKLNLHGIKSIEN